MKYANILSELKGTNFRNYLLIFIAYGYFKYPYHDNFNERLKHGFNAITFQNGINPK